MARITLFLFGLLIAFTAYGQGLPDLFRKLIDGVTKSTGSDSSTLQPTTSADTLNNLDQMWRCQTYLTWPGTPAVIKFGNPACASPLMASSEQDRLRTFVIEHYGLHSQDSRIRMEGVTAFQRDTYTRNLQEQQAREARARAESQVREAIKQAQNEEAQRGRLEQERAADRRRVEERRAEDEKKQNLRQSTSLRMAALKSGSAQIENIEDAVLFHGPLLDISAIMFSPLLTPDRAVYGGLIIIDKKEDEKSLLGKRDYGVVTYVLLRMTRSTKIFDPKLMRLNSQVGVIGRYVGNFDYRTIAGERKTAPVLEVLFIGDGTNLVKGEYKFGCAKQPEEC